MKRRNFLIGTGSTAIGGSALLGSGAFTRIESQRRVKIQVAHDSEAYLGLDGCPDSPNRSYTDFQNGHLAIEMSPENPTEAGGQGVNSDSRTWFDRVFQVCNNGKQEVCVWIQDDENWPRVDDDAFPDEDYSAYDGDRRVDFYLEDDPDQSIIGSENRVVLDVGECVCIGLRTNTKGLVEGDQLLEDLDDEIVIIADEDCPPDIPAELLGEICGEKRLTEDLADANFDAEGWEIHLYADPDRQLLLDSTTTNEDGGYCFTGLAPDTYYVCKVSQPETVQVYPEEECHEVEVGENETVDGVDFKNDLAVPPEEFEEPEEVSDTAISFIAFCREDGTEVTVTDIEATLTNEDGEPVGVRWWTEEPVGEVLLKGAGEWYKYTYDPPATTGVTWMSAGPANAEYELAEPAGGSVSFPGDEDERCPRSPCDGVRGTKVDYEGDEFDLDNAEFTQDSCPPGPP